MEESPVAEPLPTPSVPPSLAESTTVRDRPVPPPLGLPSMPPPAVPGYELLEELGRGGMGVVWKARQTALNRLVALKVIRADQLAGPDMVRRFLAEAVAVAAVHHPNVVQIHEAGTHAGQPYFTLELVAGGSLSAHLAHQSLGPSDSARLVEQIARGVQAVHERGVVHRDLKPANILLDIPAVASASPGLADAVPKVTDFGLARRLEGGLDLTLSGAIMGTPSYMAPEQAAGKGKAVGPAADVYALGAILYECLTGRPPFRGASLHDTLLAVLSDDPVPPSRLALKLPRDLETVCLKCLAKEPGRRYASAGELADDLGRYRRGEPVRARPVSRLARATRWARRRPAVAALLATVAAVTVAGAAGIAWAYGEAVRQRDAAVREQSRADAEAAAQVAARRDADEARHQVELRNAAQRRALAVSHTLLSDAARDADDLERAWEWLGLVPEDLRSFDWHFRRRRLHNGLFALYGHEGPVRCVAYSPDGRLLATGSDDRTARLWDARTGRQLLALLHPDAVVGLDFSPDGGRLATLAKGVVRVRDTATGRELFTLGGGKGRPAAWVAFNPDGRTLATGHLAGAVVALPGAPVGEVRLWDAVTGQPGRTLADVGEARVATFSLDGRRLALSGDWLEADGRPVGGVRFWDIVAGQPLFAIKGAPFGQDVALFVPGGRHLLIVSPRGEWRLYDADTGVLVRDLPAPPRPVATVFTAPAPPGRAALSPDGQYLAVPDSTALRVFDVTTGRRQAVLRGHLFPVTAVAFPPGGRLLASASGDGTVRVWDLANEPERLAVRAHERGTAAVAFAPDGRLATGGADRVVRLWDAEGRPLRELTGHSVAVRAVAFSPDGTRLASAAGPSMGAKTPGEARVWDPSSGRELFRLDGHAAAVTAVEYDRAGRLIATASLDGTVRLWDADTGRPLRQLDLGGEGMGLSFAPDGKHLAAAVSGPGGGVGVVLVWDEQGRERLRRELKGTGARGVCFSPDGRWLAVATLSMAVRLLDAGTGADVWWVQQNGLIASGLAFTPDGRRLAAATGTGELRLWDVATGQELLSERGQRTSYHGLAFSPDGRRAATGTGAGEALLWDVRPGPYVRVLRGPLGVLTSLAFSANGRQLATRSREDARLWDPRTGQPLPGQPGFPLPPDANWPRAFSSDRGLLAQSKGYIVLLTELPPVTAREEALRRWATAPQPAWHRQEAVRLRQSRPEEAALHQALAGGLPAASAAQFRRGQALAAVGDRAAAGAFLLALAEPLDGP